MDIELQSAASTNRNVGKSNSSNNDRDSDDEYIESTAASSETVSNPIADNTPHDVGSKNDVANSNEDNDEESAEDSENEPLLLNDCNEFDWERVGRAVDRVFRVLIPIVLWVGSMVLYYNGSYVM